MVEPKKEKADTQNENKDTKPEEKKPLVKEVELVTKCRFNRFNDRAFRQCHVDLNRF